MTRRTLSFGLALAAAGILAACSSNSPTAPPKPTPAALKVVLTPSATEAVVNQSILLQAKVTSGSQNVADNTAVNFIITGCVPTGATQIAFENGTCEINRTTTNGVATATLTSTIDGTFQVKAVVQGSQDSTTVTYRQPVTPGTLAIYSVTPRRGSPDGGEQILIRGRGFATPVTVDFVIGGDTYHGQVLTVNAAGTEVTAITPAIPLDISAETTADLVVTAAAGTGDDVTDTLMGGFTFAPRNEGPAIYSVEPEVGSIRGGEQVTIYGAGFVAPVRVTFNTNEYGEENAQVVSVSADKSRIVILTPYHTDSSITNDIVASVTVTTSYGTATQQSVTRQNGFTYLADYGEPILYSVTPNVGSPRGGETVTLRGANLQGASVTFSLGAPLTGQREAEVVSIEDDGTALTLVTPEASPNLVTTDIPVAFIITTPAATKTFGNVFTYQAEARVPVIYGVVPDRGSAEGGETVLIRGEAFASPVCVRFGSLAEAQVLSVSADQTEIEVLTPSASFAGATINTPIDITVVAQCGTGRDQQATYPNAFQYIEGETPEIFSLTPNSGPIEGGTRVTISGRGFVYPVQVLFGDREAQVVSSNYNTVIVMSPDISVTQPETPTTVQVTVRNMTTGKVSNEMPFRYGEAMFISAISPNQGPDLGGTQVTIFGQGFVAPVAVTLAGVPAEVLTVSGTEIVVRSGTPAQRTCTSFSGPVQVTNIDSNLVADGPNFTYTPAKPVLTNALVYLDGSSTGDNRVLEHDPTGITACATSPEYNRYTVHVFGENFERYPGGTNSAMTVVFSNPAVEVPTTWISPNEISFQLPDLSAVTLDTAPCDVGGAEGTRDIPTGLSFTVRNENNGCEDALTPAIMLDPCDPTCRTGIVQIALNPTELIIGVGTAATMTVSINAVQATDTDISLAVIGSGGIINLPGGNAVTIPAGSLSATFQVEGLNGGGPVTIQAALPLTLGGATASASVTVAQLGVTLTPTDLNLPIGGVGTFTVQLSSPAPAAFNAAIQLAGPAGVIIVQNESDGTDDGQIAFTTGQTTATFDVRGLTAGGPVTVSIQLPAAQGGASASSTVFVGQYTVTLTPDTLILPVGGTANFTVNLSAQAPAGGLHVTITQTGPAGVISITPTDVFIDANLQQGVFTVEGLAGGGPVTVTATLPSTVGGASDSATVSVISYTVFLSPPSLNLVVGNSGQFQVSLNAPAPALSNIDVEITQTGPAGIISTPATVTILAGEVSSTFQVTALAQGGPVNVIVSLPPNVGSSSASATVNVTSVALTAVPVSLTVPVGGTSTFILNLSSPAPTGGVDVTVTSANTDVAVVNTASPVNIPAGATSSGPIEVEGVNLGSTAIYAQLPVTLGAGVASVQANVSNTLSLAPASLTVPVGGQGTYTLSIAAAQTSDITANLSYAGSPAGAVSFPGGSTVTIPGGSTSATFQVQGEKPGSGTVTATLAGTVPPGVSGTTATAGITVTGLTVAVSPTTLTVPVNGTNSFIATISSPAGPGGVLVTLTSFDTAVATTTPATITIAEGSTTSAPITVNGLQQGSTTIQAKLDDAIGGSTASLFVTVTPYTLIATPSALTLTDGATGTFTVSMNVPRATDTVVTITSNNPAVATALPATVTIAAGTLTSPPVTVTAEGTGTTSIQAKLPDSIGGATANVGVTVTGYTITAIPTSLTVPQGGINTFIVVLGEPAPAGGAIVNVVSGNTSVATLGSASYPVAAGETSTGPIAVTGVNIGTATIYVTLPALGGAATQVAVNVTNGLTVTPTALTIPVAGNGTLLLTMAVAQPSDTLVQIDYSGAAGAVTGPATVTILANEVNAVFDVTGVLPTTSTPVTVTATLPDSLPAGLGGAQAQATVTVSGSPLTLSMSPATITLPVGGTADVDVNLSSPAPVAFDVTLTLSQNDIVSLSTTTLSYAVSDTQQTFTVTADALGGPVTITATGGTAVGSPTATAAATVQAGSATLTLNPTPFVWYVSSTGTPEFTLGLSPTQATDTEITLATTNPLVVEPPASETVTAGASTVTFNPTVNGVGTATITATLPAYLSGAAVTSQATVFDVDLTPSSITGLLVGETRDITVTLDRALDSALVLAVAASSGAVTVPSSVILPAGATQVTIPVTGADQSLSPATVTVTLPADVGGDDLPVVNVTVLGPTISLTPASATIYKTQTLTMTVTLGAAQATDTTVSLSSSLPGTVSVPADVVVPGGSTSASFTATSESTSGTATITATLPAALGGASDTSSVTNSDVPLTLSSAATSLYFTESKTVTASIPVPLPGAAVVTLTSSDPTSLSVPATVTIPAGATSATFQAVAADGNSGTAGAITISGSLPAALNATAPPHDTLVLNLQAAPLTLSPAAPSIMASGAGTITVSIPTALSIPVDVALVSDDPFTVSVPTTMTIPAGATSATFDAVGEATAPGGGSTATITATASAASGGASDTATATVTALTVSTTPTVLNNVPVGTEQLVTVTLGTLPAKSVTLTLNIGDILVASTRDTADPSNAIGQLTLPAGTQSAQFQVRAVGVGVTEVDLETPATLGGTAAPEAVVGVVSEALQISIAPTTLSIAGGAYGTLTASITNLSGGVLAVPVSVNLAGGDHVWVDNDTIGGGGPTAIAIIPAGANSVDFYVYGYLEGGPDAVTATLDASVGGGTATANVGVYPGVPVITSVSPMAAPSSGFSPVAVTIIGGNFAEPFTVEFGGVAEPSCAFQNPGLITCAAIPPHADGIVPVTVTVGANVASWPGFKYYPPVGFTGVSPDYGSTLGGDTVTVNGTFLAGGKYTVYFDGIAADMTGAVATGTQITGVVTPAHAKGAVQVIVEDEVGGNFGITPAFSYYPPPSVTSLAPAAGTINGGTSVTLFGDFLNNGTYTVEFGAGNLGTVTSVSGANINVTTPAGTNVGLFDVIVTDEAGQSTTVTDGFTYQATLNITLGGGADGDTSGVTSTPAGISCAYDGGTPVAQGGTCSFTFGYGAVTLQPALNTSASNTGWTWSGATCAACTPSAPCDIFLTADPLACTVTFTP